MKLLIAVLLAFSFSLPAQAQAPAGAPPIALPLWPQGAPGALGKTPDDIPTLTPYLPDAAAATGAALVICPGGGYSGLSMDHEGRAYAQWLKAQGFVNLLPPGR